MNHIPFNRAEVTDSDRQMLASSINNGHISGNGTFTKRAEELITLALGVKRTLLTTSCTHALEMSALLAQLKPGDEVIMEVEELGQLKNRIRGAEIEQK
jgi:dTDP-4-amino-4,6-dideoxygalactose transaminase